MSLQKYPNVTNTHTTKGFLIYYDLLFITTVIKLIIKYTVWTSFSAFMEQLFIYEFFFLNSNVNVLM